jgi:hypothetical protein
MEKLNLIEAHFIMTTALALYFYVRSEIHLIYDI